MAGIVARNGMDGLAVATVLAGILLILMGVLRMGSMIKFIPYTITTGFTAGIAVTIVVGQLKDFFGVTFQNSPAETVEKLEEFFACFSTWSMSAVAVGCVALVIQIIWPRFFAKIPASLVAVIVTAAMVKLLHLPVNTIGVYYSSCGISCIRPCGSVGSIFKEGTGSQYGCACTEGTGYDSVIQLTCFGTHNGVVFTDVLCETLEICRNAS